MTTIVDGLSDATSALNAAVAGVLGLRSDVAAQIAANNTSVTTIIQNFSNRAPTKDIFIDPTNGNDANTGETLDTPVKTFDRAWNLKGTDGYNSFLCLDNITIRNNYSLFSSLTINGIQRGSGANGAAYSFKSRTVTFLSEADNSPAVGIGRTAAGFFVIGPRLRYQNIDVMMGDPIADINNKVHHQVYGGEIQMSNSSISIPRVGAVPYFMAAAEATIATLIFSGVFGANAAGRIMSGVAAGANPNSNQFYRSNLTSV